MSLAVDSDSMTLVNVVSFRLAPTKLVLLSLQILSGFPLLEQNLRSEALNALDVKSSIASIYAALVEKQTNIDIQAFLPGLPRIPLRIVNGPAKSTPIFV